MAIFDEWPEKGYDRGEESDSGRVKVHKLPRMKRRKGEREACGEKEQHGDAD